MRFSPAFNATWECTASQDGKFIATLHPLRVVVRSVQTLKVVNEFNLPADLPGAVSTFMWSPSSLKLLLVAGHQMHVVSALDTAFHATIRFPASLASKPSLVSFGPDDDTVCVCSSFGLKFALYNLATGKVAEISNPKFHQASTATKGFSFRQGSSHLALLTRSSGRDLISIHCPRTSELQRSWHPDVVDAQGLAWTSGGRWLLVWESAAHGHKLLFYTADGHLFRTWNGPQDSNSALSHMELGAGIKQCHLSPNGTRATVCDYTRMVYVMDTTAPAAETMRLHHPTGAIKPRDSLQIWQEQLPQPQIHGSSQRPFVRMTQPISPPGRPTRSGVSSELALGGVSAAFDSSSALVATRMEDNPSTVWIWDTSAAELRAVLIFHCSVASVRWHPSMHELLLVSCQDDKETLVFVWDPLSAGPNFVDCAQHLLCRQQSSNPDKIHASWVDLAPEDTILMLISNGRSLLVSTSDSDNSHLAWHDSNLSVGASTEDLVLETAGTDDDASEMDDTFSFKRTPR